MKRLEIPTGILVKMGRAAEAGANQNQLDYILVQCLCKRYTKRELEAYVLEQRGWKKFQCWQYFLEAEEGMREQGMSATNHQTLPYKTWLAFQAIPDGSKEQVIKSSVDAQVVEVPEGVHPETLLP